MVKKLRIELFDVVNYTLLTLVTLLMIYPLLNVASVSISTNADYIENPLMIWPKHLDFQAYKDVFRHPLIWSSYRNTIVVTLLGVAMALFLYIITAYPLSKKHLKGRSVFMKLIVFTMLFNGGLIPNFYLIRSLGLIDNLLALVLPSIFSGFNVILMKNFFESIPESLEEAAKIDGASEIYILSRIIVPLSKPIIATLCLFTAVSFWNSFFAAVVYIRSPQKWTLQLMLREIILGASMQEISTGGNSAEMSRNIPTESLKYAALMVVMLPILCVYPFVQRYFVSGIMVGSVKD